jgi:hypothetical protein
MKTSWLLVKGCKNLAYAFEKEMFYNSAISAVTQPQFLREK